jgi:mono/diheme cytochrome c family protein
MERVRPAFWVAALLVTLWSLPVYAQQGEVSYAKGLSVFKDKGCAHCHAVFGRGGKGGPDLGKRKFYGTYLELAARMWNHFPPMYKKMQKENVEFHKVDSKEMGQLMTYLSFIRYRGEPGNEYKGQKLLKGRCGPCHKFRGEGGDVGPEFDQSSGYMSTIRLVESMWNHGPDMMEVFREQNVKRPVSKGMTSSTFWRP